MREQIPNVAPFLRVGGKEWYLPTALRALNHRAYRLYWIGQLVSLTGSWMQSTAQQWLVYRLTGSPLALGTVMLCQSLPVTLLSLPAGVVIDRVDKRKFLATVEGVMGLLAFALAALVASGHVQFWHVLVVATLLGVVNTFDMATRQAFTIEMVGRDDVMNAVALNSSIFNGARLAGPAIAGILVSRLGEAPAFALNGLSFVAVIAALLAMKVPFPSPPHSGESSHWSDLRESLRYIVSTHDVLALCVMAGVASMLGFTFTTLIPVMADKQLHLGADGFGVLVSSLGFGALVGAVSLAARGGVHRAGILLTVARLAFAAGIAGFALSTWLPLSMASLVVAGWGMITHLASTNTLLQLRVPDALRGRVLAAYLWAIVGTAPIGNIALGAAAERWGAPHAILAASVACAIAVVVSIVAWPRILTI
jgi:MFS family permease